MTAPVLDRSDPVLVEQIVRRAGRPDFDRWAEQVERCGHCSRPVRLRGYIERADGSSYSTDSEPDRVLLKRCGNRRASVCPSCSYEYAGDMWQLLYAGAAGGRKGVPESIRSHPLVFATLTAPGFGPVHGTRTGSGSARCRPPRGKPALCAHGRPTWCTRVHGEDDPRLGEPLCADCYDYAGHAAFNWWAPELWRRFTITLRRVLARRAGLTPAAFSRRCRLSFVKVAEFQRRAVVHFHALIRLDAAGEGYRLSDVPLGAGELADAVREAALLVRFTAPLPRSLPPATAEHLGFNHDQPHESGRQDEVDPPGERGGPGSAVQAIDEPLGQQRQPHQPEHDTRAGAEHLAQSGPVSRGAHQRTVPANQDVSLCFGKQVDVQPINGDTDGDLTPKRAAAYIAKYATKSAEDFGLGDRRLTGPALAGDGVTPHVARLVRTCWALGDLDEYAGIRKWIHMAGFRGHFASKSRRYSTTLGAIRGERQTFRRRQAAEHARQLGLDPIDENTTLVVSRWEFTGLGYLTAGDAALALSAAARARERRDAARDESPTDPGENP